MFHNANLMGILANATLLPTIIGLMFAPKIIGKFGLRNAINGGLAIGFVGLVLTAIFPENFTMLLVGLVIFAFGKVPMTAGISAIVADTGDMIYWKTGVPVQGAVFSVTSAGIKIGTGLSTAAVGWALSLSNYLPNAKIQPDSAVFGLKFLYIYFPLISTIVMFIVIALMKYEKFMPILKEEIKMGRVGKLRDQSIEIK